MRVNNVCVIAMCIFYDFPHQFDISDFEKRTSPKSCFLSVLVVGFYILIWTICRIWFGFSRAVGWTDGSYLT